MTIDCFTLAGHSLLINTFTKIKAHFLTMRKFILLFSIIIFLVAGYKLYSHFAQKTLEISSTSDKPSLKIVTSFTILRDFAEKITSGVPNVEIISIVPPESDPHVYQPTPLDATALTKADVVFLNGLNFEKGVEGMLKSTDSKAVVSMVAQHVKARPDLMDPHTWHNVQNAVLYVKEMTRVLSDIDPKNAKIYQKNSVLLLRELEKLDLWIREEISKTPEKERIVVTTHDAFWYFGQAYGIQFMSPIGISTEAEASAQNVATLINFIRDHKIKAVFVENLANPRLIEQIANETNTLLQGTLYADSLSVSNGSAPDYISMIKHNVQTICKALNQ